MPKTVKSLVCQCQEILSKCLDELSEVGCVPYYLLEPSLVYATPQQLLRIEKANPDLAKESDELWLKHCLLFRDIKQEYDQGLHRDPKKWRGIYMARFEETERKRRLVSEKVKNQYSKIQNEKEKKSIKLLSVMPTNRNKRSKIFQQTRRETNKLVSLYNSNHTRPIIKPNPIIRVPTNSNLAKQYQSIQLNYPPINSLRKRSPPLVAPASNILPPPSLPPPMKKHKMEEKKKKPTAIVNFNIFNELS